MRMSPLRAQTETIQEREARTLLTPSIAEKTLQSSLS